MKPKNKTQLYETLEKHSTVNREPAPAFKDGDLIGNGDVGVSIYGSPERFSFCLAKNDLWDTRIEGGRSNLPEGGITQIKKILKSGNRKEWDKLKHEILFKVQRDYPAPMHGLNLDLELNRGSIFGSFERRLNLANGLWRCKYNLLGDIPMANEGLGWCEDKTELQAFLTENNCLFIEYSPFSGFNLDPEYYKPRTQTGPFALHLSFLYKDGVANPEFFREGDVQLAGREMPNGEYFLAGFLTNVPADKTYVSHLQVSFWKDQPTEGKFLAVLKSEKFSKHPTENKKKEFLKNLRGSFRAGFEKELEKSSTQWRRYWENGSAVFLEDQTIERAWYQDVYLLNTISRPGKFLPGLQGPYTRTCAVPWNGDFHTDCNIEANYWFCYSGNRPEPLKPFFDYYWSIIPQAKADTKKYYGSEKGLKFPQASDPAGHELGGYLSAAIWQGNSGWLAKMFVDYWEYFGEQDFLFKRAWPILRDVAIFYADMAVKLEDGLYHVYPSYLPEWQCSNLESLGYDSPSDLACFQYVFSKTLQLCKLYPELTRNVPAGYLDKWREIAAGLPGYPVSRTGKLLPLKYENGGEPNFIQSGFWFHHLFLGVFPMEVINPEDKKHPVVKSALKGLKEYLRARKKGTDMRVVSDPYNLWSAWFAILASRVDPENYWETLQLAHHPKAVAGKHIIYDIILEIDGCSSFAAAVNEGFVQSWQPGRIIIGRGLPKKFTGECERMLARGGIEISVSFQSGKLENLELISRQDCILQVDFGLPPASGLKPSGFILCKPEKGGFSVKIKAGQPAKLSKK